MITIHRPQAGRQLPFFTIDQIDAAVSHACKAAWSMGHAIEKLPQLYQQMTERAFDGGPLAGGIRLAFKLINRPLVR
jgi:hypothetical protein